MIESIYSQSVKTLSVFTDIDAKGSNIYVSTLGFGVLKSTNRGDSWFLASTGIEGKDILSVAISPSDTNQLVATVWNNCCPVGGFLGVYKSTNGGNNWVQINTGLSVDLGPIAYDPSNSSVIYVGGYFGAFYKTTNGGNNWASISGLGGDVNSLLVQSNGTVWAGGWGGLQKSTNGGTNWQTLSGIPYGNVFKIISYPSDVNAIYINIDLSGVSAIYKTTNGGSSWSQVGQSIGGGNILGFGNSLSNVFVGNKKGCYKTSDGGSTWSVVDTTSLLLLHQGSAANNNLYVVGGGGIFVLSPVTVNVEGDFDIKPLKFSLSHNYPNPFNPSTVIEFQINEESSVTIDIYDSQGELVKNLLSKELQTGVYTVRWDGTNTFGNRLASGTYFYRVHAGNQFDVKKMILLK